MLHFFSIFLHLILPSPTIFLLFYKILRLKLNETLQQREFAGLKIKTTKKAYFN